MLIVYFLEVLVGRYLSSDSYPFRYLLWNICVNMCLSFDCKTLFNFFLKFLQVLFSDYFRKSFQKLRSFEMKKLVINLLLRLSSGWRPKKRKSSLINDNTTEMLKQFKVKDLYIVCSIDIMKESWYKQVLKVWDILPLEEIPKLAKHLDALFGKYTDDYLNRCKVKCFDRYVHFLYYNGFKSSCNNFFILVKNHFLL